MVVTNPPWGLRLGGPEAHRSQGARPLPAYLADEARARGARLPMRQGGAGPSGRREAEQGGRGRGGRGEGDGRWGEGVGGGTQGWEAEGGGRGAVEGHGGDVAGSWQALSAFLKGQCPGAWARCLLVWFTWG